LGRDLEIQVELFVIRSWYSIQLICPKSARAPTFPFPYNTIFAKEVVVSEVNAEEAPRDVNLPPPDDDGSLPIEYA
jgi:hypothetical protein